MSNLLTGTSADIDQFVSGLVMNGKLSKEDQQRFSIARSGSNQPVDVVFTQLGLLPDVELAKLFATYFGQPPLQADQLQVDTELVNKLGLPFLKQSFLLPLKRDDETLAIGIPDPFDNSALLSAEFLLEQTVVPYAIARAEIVKQLNALSESLNEASSPAINSQSSELSSDDLDRLQDVASEAPVVRFVTQAIQEAVDRRATDIHLEPQLGRLVARCRVDGILHHIAEEPAAMHSGIITRIKVLSRLNIAERRRPQDGRMRVSIRGKNIDLRVSILPTVNGETAVLRILDKSAIPLDLPKLGFEKRASEQLLKLAGSPNGMILATGPTGSGKTTTLYALLQKIMRPEVKIFTIEDPVEYKLDNAIQLQVNPEIDFTFANALRSVLRQDPDVILVGEIRDKETAEIAIRASLTGHLVFSTLHTNSAAEAITRLRDMGLDSFLLAATIRGIIAQRLLRSTCDECGGETNGTVCKQCSGTGYYGRSVCYEILPFSKSIADDVSSGHSSFDIARCAEKEGMITLTEHAKSMVSSRRTSIDEVRRVIDLQDF